MSELNNLIKFFESDASQTELALNPNASYEETTLNCNINNYNSTYFSKEWVKTFIPKNYLIHINLNSGKIGKHNIYYPKYLNDRIIFNYVKQNPYDKNSVIEHIFFKKSKKLNISFYIPDNQWRGTATPSEKRDFTNIIDL